MKTQLTALALLIISVELGLAFAANTKPGDRASDDFQQNRQNMPPPPMPPRNSNVGHVPRPTPTPCPKVRECTAAESDTPTQLHVEFPGPGSMTLHGHLYVPDVKTRAELEKVTKKFPVMIYNHGSEPDPKGVPHLARLYVNHGFVFFAPDRHGQGLSKDAGPYILDLQKAAHDAEASVELHELYNKDVMAAIKWIKEQPYTDTEHIAMTGISYGGIQTLLTAEKDPGIRAYIPFAPAAMSWGSVPLEKRLIEAVRNEKAPMFLIQAEGDYNLGPSETLGPILRGKGDERKWKNRIYPKFGCTNEEAHATFAMQCAGIAIWDQDVLKFLHDVGEL
ncbi:MAG: carboxymethylenebutenolidase [Acidobacteriota bacterium]|jgi:dienelactone hydrolase|nr:carboxymethylenebutenolidase [Acidobacteriota bacterium]